LDYLLQHDFALKFVLLQKLRDFIERLVHGLPNISLKDVIFWSLGLIDGKSVSAGLSSKFISPPKQNT
jgi:hypothetical protein